MKERYIFQFDHLGILKMKEKKQINRIISFLNDKETEGTYNMKYQFQEKICDLNSKTSLIREIIKLNVFILEKIKNKKITGVFFHKKRGEINFALSRQNSFRSLEAILVWHFVEQGFEICHFKIYKNRKRILRIAKDFGFKTLSAPKSNICINRCPSKQENEILRSFKKTNF